MTQFAIRLNRTANFLRNPENGLSIMIALVMLLFSIKCVSIALTTTFSFDGAVETQSAQNLAKNFKYTTSYQGKLFDPIMKIGIPVILPEAILFYFFGESFASGLMVSAIYLILVAIAMIYYTKKCVRLNASLILLAIVMLFGIPNLFTYGFGLYGEIPTLFYLILLLIFLYKYEDTLRPKYLFWAGVSLGMGYLTKTVILICVPALLFAATFDFLVKRHLTLKNRCGVKRFIQEYLLLPAGFFVCVIIFELFRLISLGFPDYLQWWKDELRLTLLMAGVTQELSDTQGIIVKLIAHLNILASFWGIHKFVIVFLLGILLMAFTAILYKGTYNYRKRQRPGESEKKLFSSDILVLITVILSYFGWWLLILPTQHAWERYIFNGYILLELCLVIGVSFLIQNGKRSISKQRKGLHILYWIFTLGYIGLLLVGAGYYFFNSQNYLISFKDSPEKTALLEARGYISNLPESAVIYGYDWWQAPVVAFASGKTFENLLSNFEMRNPGIFDDKYLIVDSYGYYLDAGASQNILEQYDHRLVFSREPMKLFIYKLNSRGLFAYKEFSASEKKQVAYSKINFSRSKLNAFVRNVYTNEKNNTGKWAQDVSGYLFKYNGESRLIINLWIPDPIRMEQHPLELEIYANRKPVYHFEVNQENSYEIVVPLKDINCDTLEITIICNARYKNQGDARPFSFFLTKMELEN